MSNLTLKTRRKFLQGTLLGGAVSWTVPTFLARTFSVMETEAANSATQPTTGKDGTILVVMQMAGGNDGLNTIVPHANDYYYKARSTLALRKNLIKLNDEFAFHPGFEPLKALFDAGQFSIIHGVGYPNPNRSHFVSTEIWHTAGDGKRVRNKGWLGSYFDNACPGADPTIGLSVGRQMPQAFSGSKGLGISLETPENYRLASSDLPGQGETGNTMDFLKKMNRLAEAEDEPNSGATVSSVTGKIQSGLSPLDYVQRTAMDAQVSSEKILSVSRKATNLATYPSSPLANSLKLVARLIAGGLNTRVYYVSQGGYDTHTNQAGAHQRLLADFASSVKAFMDDLKAQGNTDRVLLLTFSEFGRRVAQNANNGTDHGAAAPMFLFGSKIKGGFLGKFPSLAPADLHNGDLKFTTDFRGVYSGVLKHWLNTDPTAILGRKFAPLDCFV